MGGGGCDVADFRQREHAELFEVPFVRTLIADDTNPYLFTTEQLGEFVIRAGSALLGAAMALDVIASSEALLSKKITTQDLSTDGPAVADSLRKHAAALRAQDAAERAETTRDDVGLIVIPPRPAHHRPGVAGFSW